MQGGGIKNLVLEETLQMLKKTRLKPIVAAIGTTFAVTLAASPVMATENPFGLNNLSSGYMIAGAATEGKCGEGKCGGDKSEEAEGKCGEGKCGGDK